MAAGSILETLYILFKSNAKDVQKDMEDTEKKTKKTVESLNAFGKANEDVRQSFLGLAESFKSLIFAGIGVSAVLGGLKHATEYATEVAQASKNLQVNAADLDA